MTNRLHLTATCLAFFLGTSAVRAQEVVAGSFDQLRLAARLGDTITVTDAAGATTTGRLAALSSSQLTLLVGKSPRDLLEQDVRAIARHGHVSLAQGARWGFAIGGGIGLLAGLSWSSACNTCGPLTAVFAATYASLGAGLGVGIAAVTPTRPVIYSVNGDGRRRVAVSPIATPGRRGASLSVAF